MVSDAKTLEMLRGKNSQTSNQCHSIYGWESKINYNLESEG